MLAVPSILIHKISCRELTYPVPRHVLIWFSFSSGVPAGFRAQELEQFRRSGGGTVPRPPPGGSVFWGVESVKSAEFGENRKFMHVGWINTDYIDIYIYSHRIHVWYVCLHLVIFCSINVGKYSSRMDPMVDHSCLLMSFLSLKTLGEEMSLRLV